MEKISLKDLTENKGIFFEQTEQEAKHKSFDVFSNDFSNVTDPSLATSNPYNFSEVASICENLTSDGGVKKLLMKRGTGPVVPSNANVTYKFVAYTEFGDTPFDYSKKQVNMDIGMSTLKGISIALASMKKGEKASFYVEPNYAYGKFGCPPKIPPNSTCLFIIELLDYEEMPGAGEYYDRTPKERPEAPYEIFISVLKYQMKEAKDLFAKENYEKALRIYENMAFRLGKFDDHEGEDFKKSMISLNCNSALCCLKLSEYESCIKFADIALSYDFKHAKALYAKGKALHRHGCYELAVATLLEAKKISPKNRDINEELHYLDKYVEKWHAKEKELCQKMMKKLNSEDGDEICAAPNGKSENLNSGFHIDPHSILTNEICEVFQQHLIDLNESVDLTQDITLSSEIFSIDELCALETLAKSFLLRVYWTKLNHGHDFIRISKI